MQNRVTTYQTIEAISQIEFKDRGSKFLAFAIPIETIFEFKNELKRLKELHPKANHHCFAYRLGQQQLQYRVSDDGEPSGTAGKPILGQIDSNQLTNILVVVVRYFGGTMLGVPGLINAYKTSAKMCIEQNNIVVKNILECYALEFDYTIMNDIMRIVKQVDASYEMQEGGLFCKMIVKIPLINSQQATDLMKDIRTLQYKLIENEML